jgi:hypothetical protein
VTNYNNPTSQADRLAALHNETLQRKRAGASTLLDHVSNDSGGRFAAIGKPTVIGSEPTAKYPTLPSSSPWSGDGVGIEPPLDATFCGDVFGEALGEPHEQPLGEAEALADVQHPALAVETASPIHTPSPLLLPQSVRDRVLRRKI